MRFTVMVTQVYRVERTILVEVEAEDEESAIEQQSQEAAPDFDDPGWKSGWSLENEAVSAR
ncbi:hypothetical protein N2601_32255 (plasmid) [Rhizobium sp. CB3060]|uniref:hypothetical protein n=1 Tax=Rhizobium sp. CB3060 TaxID=3138255 RepID=UPI0021A6F8A4|nr:hypothetical protein [Rhizobium tropici]UWU26003.1 hypothetical protein N2601_32255 [Rhizobium tropici]